MKEIAISIHATESFNPDILKGLKGYDYIHVDVMDGKFVNNTCYNLEVFKILKEYYDTPIIAHLMSINPVDKIDRFINYIDYFIFHFECEEDKSAIIEKFRQINKKVGIAINPDTKITEIIHLLDKIDIVLVMSVYPGWSGQKFLPEIIEKVNRLAKYKNTYDFKIDVDGGVNLENAMKLKYADILSSASTILEAEDPNLIIELLKESDKNAK